MDNDLDKRLGQLEAGQKQILAGQERILRALLEMNELMRQPDEEGEKLHVVLAKLVLVMTTNTETLLELKQAITEKPAGSA